MADYVYHITANDMVSIIEEDAERIRSGEWEEDIETSCLTFYLTDGPGEDLQLYIYHDDGGGANLDEVSEDFKKFIGSIIGKAGKPYIEFGVASYCTKPRPESTWGGAFRWHADGTIEWSKRAWASDTPQSKVDNLLSLIKMAYETLSCIEHKEEVDINNAISLLLGALDMEEKHGED